MVPMIEWILKRRRRWDFKIGKIRMADGNFIVKVLKLSPIFTLIIQTRNGDSFLMCFQMMSGWRSIFSKFQLVEIRRFLLERYLTAPFFAVEWRNITIRNPDNRRENPRRMIKNQDRLLTKCIQMADGKAATFIFRTWSESKSVGTDYTTGMKSNVIA